MTLDDDDEDDDTSAIDDGRGGNIGSSAPRIDDDDDDGEKDKADDVDTSSAIDDSEDIQSARFNPHARRVLIPMQIRQGVEQRPTLRPNTEPQEGQAEEEKIDAFTKAMEHFQVGDLQVRDRSE